VGPLATSKGRPEGLANIGCCVAVFVGGEKTGIMIGSGSKSWLWLCERLARVAAAGLLAACGAEPAGNAIAPAVPGASGIPTPRAANAAESASAVPSRTSAAEPNDRAAASGAPSVVRSTPTPDARRGAVAEAEPPPLPKGTTVLQVGDSMADALGKDLGRELEARGVRSILKAKEATYIPEWAGFSMGLKSLLLIHKPDLVIITLGGNEVAMLDPSVRAEPVRKIVETIGDRPCVWVGAPLWGPHTGILEVIRANCGHCRFVDTNTLAPNLERLKDGVHPTLLERKRWAKAMVEWLARQREPAGQRPWELRAE
jgi:hypothetical protein